MARVLKVGMIGAGFIGQLAHLMNLVEVPECKVVALAEYRPLLREQVARRYDIPRTYATHVELLADSEVEAVVVVTPRAYTALVVLDCLRAGKHVLSEKPMAGTLKQAEMLVAEAEKSGVHYAVAYMKRYDAAVEYARAQLQQVLQDGSLGPIGMVRAHCFMGDSYCKADGHVVTEEKPDYPDGGWPMWPDDFSETKGRDYAFYLNTFSHNVNLLRHLLGGVPDIDFVRFDNQLGRVAVLRFGDYATVLECGRMSHRGWDETSEIHFADGLIRIETPPALLKNVPGKVQIYRAGAVQEVLSPQLDWTWAMRKQSCAFVHDCLEGGPGRNPAHDSLHDLRLIEAMWRRA